MIGRIEERDSLARYLEEVCAVWGDGSDPQLPRRVEALLERLLASASPFESWISTLIAAALPAKELYRDRERGFVQIGYIRDKGHRARPHDHGPCWVLHGVYHGVTEITTYRRDEQMDPSGRVALAIKETRRLTQGIAVAYLPGEIHSVFVPEPSVILTLFSRDPTSAPRNRYLPDDANYRVERIEPLSQA